MFIRAGFNPRHRVLATARVRIGRIFAWAHLVVSVPAGELHWRVPNVIRVWKPDYVFDVLRIPDLQLDHAASRARKAEARP